MSVPFLFANFVPREYRPLLGAISPAAFSVIDWRQILKMSPTLLRRIAEREGVADLAKSLSEFWSHSVATENKIADGKTSKEALSAQDAQIVGEAMLDLYFAQIFNSSGLFLDLRMNNVSLDEKHEVSYAPNGFWVQWADSFRHGLLDIYSGYYEDRTDLLEQGLERVGLVNSEMLPEKVEEIKTMLLSHIGGDFKNQRFLVSDFTASFDRFFKFLLENKIKLSTDFLFLGIYLASLYHCLQETGASYDVQKSFERVKNNVKAL